MNLSPAPEVVAGQARLAAALASVGDGVFIMDAAGCVEWMNPAAEALTGRSRAAVAGRPLADVLPLRDERTRAPCESAALGVLRAPEKSAPAVARLLPGRAGRERIVSEKAAPLRDAADAVTGAVLVVRDLTRERRQAGELARADKLESLGLLAGGIAHDFSNLLTALIGNLTLAQRVPGVPDPAVARLNEIERVAWRARDLTQRLLTFAKGGAPFKQPLALPALIREAVDFTLHGANVRGECDLPSDLWRVEADEAQLAQVIRNLALNAVQAMPQGGRLRVSAANVAPGADSRHPWQADAMVRISVADEGPGIPPEHLKRIFDPFFTTKPKGAGLGLATAYSIVKKHGGLIEVESTPGAGAAFHVFLPALAGAVAPVAQGENAALAAPPAEIAAAREGARILLMDDERDLRDAVGRMLGLLGYAVETTADGAAALAAYRAAREKARPFAAVIFDLCVPAGMGGAEAIRRLRVFDPRARAVVASGYSDDPVMANHRACGFDAALAKPFKMADLKRVLGEVLAQGN